MLFDYFRTSGTATRSEVWGVFGVQFCLSLAGQLFIQARGAELIGLAAYVIAFIVGIAIICTIARRLTALGYSKYWALLMFVPLVNLILLIYAGTAKAREA